MAKYEVGLEDGRILDLIEADDIIVESVGGGTVVLRLVLGEETQLLVPMNQLGFVAREPDVAPDEINAQ